MDKTPHEAAQKHHAHPPSQDKTRQKILPAAGDTRIVFILFATPDDLPHLSNTGTPETCLSSKEVNATPTSHHHGRLRWAAGQDETLWPQGDNIHRAAVVRRRTLVFVQDLLRRVGGKPLWRVEGGKRNDTGKRASV
jgi:hypothetical protein